MPLSQPAPDTAAASSPSALRKITLLQLLAATYFMVAGGPYSLEEVVKNAGYFGAIAILLIVPVIWSLPTALMCSELSTAIPEEGGYYTWVRRALGPFWGFQEAWLSLSASVFDMAIYPGLFIKYFFFLIERSDWANKPPLWSVSIGLLVIAACVLANLRGARTVGGSSLVMICILLGPFVVLSAGACFIDPPGPDETATEPVKLDYVAALVFAMFNYMGWDNATTVAGEVEKPRRTYPLALGGALLLVMLTYVLPVLAAERTGIDPAEWDTGSWTTVGKAIAGPALYAAIAIGGMVAALGTFNSLVLSYTRVPVVLARDGFLPAIFARCHPTTGAPWVSILACAVVWGLALQLSLTRLLALDVILYGLSLVLEFAALVALRIREPNLARPFKVPGGLIVAVLLGLGPALLIGVAIYDQGTQWEVAEGDDDPIAPAYALMLGMALAALGPVVYWASQAWRRDATSEPEA